MFVELLVANETRNITQYIQQTYHASPLPVIPAKDGRPSTIRSESMLTRQQECFFHCVCCNDLDRKGARQRTPSQGTS